MNRGTSRWLTILASAWLSACSCDRSWTTIGPADAAETDAALDTGRDAPDADLGPFDAGLDLGPFDAAVEDLGIPVARTGRVRINEVVASPKHDWSSTSAGQLPFDARPGTGLISSSDQFVELVNLDVVPIDLRGARLVVVDGEPDETILGSTSAVVVGSPGSSVESLLPGGYLVVGDPSGFISTDATLSVHDVFGTVLDDVEIGGLTVARDTEQDGTFDGAPDSSWNGFARGAFDESVARDAISTDTERDGPDFDLRFATPGGPNVAPVPPIEAIRPQALGVIGGNPLRIAEGIEVWFDEPVDPRCADTAVIVRVNGRPVPLALPTYDDEDRRMVVNPVGRFPFGARLDVTVLGGDSGVCDRVGNRLAPQTTATFFVESDVPTGQAFLFNELCISPQRDYDDSTGGDGVPFIGPVGTQRPNSADEWIELLHLGTASADARGLRIEVWNGFNLYVPARVTTTVGSGSSVIRVFGAGAPSAVAPLDLVVVGNPASSSLAHAVFVLRTADGRLLDYVEVGGTTAATDRGGDGLGDGAPGPGLDGSSTSPLDDGIRRIPGRDTHDDLADWERGPSTLGAPNGP